MNTVGQQLPRFIQEHYPSHGPVHNVEHIVQTNPENCVQLVQTTDCRRDSTQSHNIMIVFLGLVSLIGWIQIGTGWIGGFSSFVSLLHCLRFARAALFLSLYKIMAFCNTLRLDDAAIGGAVHE
jgi:hypothetical protein